MKNQKSLAELKAELMNTKKEILERKGIKKSIKEQLKSVEERMKEELDEDEPVNLKDLYNPDKSKIPNEKHGLDKLLNS